MRKLLFLLAINAGISIALSAYATGSKYPQPVGFEPKIYELLEKPKYWEGEGMSGYHARVINKNVEMHSVCFYGEGKSKFKAFEASQSVGDEIIEFNLSVNEENERLLPRDKVANYMLIPYHFYVMTCGK